MGGALLVTPSVRYDLFDAGTHADDVYLSGNPGSPAPEDYEDSQVTATLGAVYALTDAISASGQYSEGFRAPPYDDVNVGFTNFPAGYKTIANPDLESERSQGVATRRSFSGRPRPCATRRVPKRYRGLYRVLCHRAPTPSKRRHRPRRWLAHIPVRQPGLGCNQWMGVRRSVEPGGWFRAACRGCPCHRRGPRNCTAPLNSIEPLNAVLGLGYDAPGRFTQPGFYAALTLRMEFQGR